MPPHTVILDVIDQVPDLSGPLLMSVWIFTPRDQGKGIVFCLDAKASYHLVVPAHPQEMFSFALYMDERGWLVIAIDPLGSGESTCPIQEVTTERHSSANECEHYYLYGIDANGSFVELISVLAKMCVPVPATCTDEAAAMAHGCAIALHALRRAQVVKGQIIALFGVGNIGSLTLACLHAQIGEPFLSNGCIRRKGQR